MLNIYYGRESVDKEKFLYEKVREDGFGLDSPVTVIVPDQYTLEAERQAFRYLETDGLVGLEISSLSRLGHSLLSELGGGREAFVDKYGRQMLLTKIAEEEEDHLKVFGGSVRKQNFLTAANDFISQMKQYGITPEQLQEIASLADDKPLLSAKLMDLQRIYQKYQEEIAGKYTDSEDYLDLFFGKIGESERIRRSRIWVYGFDSFAPKSQKILSGLMKWAVSVNIVLTMDRNCPDEELYAVTERLSGTLQNLAKDIGCPIGEVRKLRAEESGHSMLFSGKNEAIRFLETELFAVWPREYSKAPDGIKVVEAGNIYSEAESAAAFVRHLIRDKGLRRRDIALICNDQKTRAPIIRRVFEEHDLRLFIDGKRSVADSSLAVLLLSLLTTVWKRYRSQDIFRALKTGLTDITGEETEKLENYVLKYRINGMRWKTPFTHGLSEYGEQGLSEIEKIRERVCRIFEGMEKICRGKQTNAEFTAKFYKYLTDTLGVPKRIQKLIRSQEEAGLSDTADVWAQIWNFAVSLLDQITELIGDQPFRTEMYRDLLSTGFSSIEIGVIPSTVDDLILGTVQRSRRQSVRAMVILGANEGVLPEEIGDNGLFSEDELEELADQGKEICKLGRVQTAEERIALHRALSMPSEYLYISFANSDAEGKETRPSELIETIRELYPELPVERDILSREEELPLVDAEDSTFRHLTVKMERAVRHSDPAGPVWDAVYRWYQSRRPERLERLDEGLQFKNRPTALPRKQAELLFSHKRGERVLSPSRLERYSRCPFSYFTQFGLRPEERRVYEAGSREIGDLYHRTLMDVTKKLSEKHLWDTVTERECRAFVDEAVKKETSDYREGLFSYTGRESYRAGRLKAACMEALGALIEQARAGAIKDSAYEIGFGPGDAMDPIEVDAGGVKIYITGRIDRMDILENDRVKIIDYKSGNLELRPEEASGGYSLQLMLYLDAAEQGGRKPAGAFYFHIQEPRVKDAETDEEIEEAIRKSFKLNGLLVDDEETVREVAGSMEPGESSPVLELKKKKDGNFSSNKVLLSEEEFEELENAVRDKIKELCRRMTAGEIEIRPMYRVKNKTSVCKYCEFSGICRFDPDYQGNRYEPVG
ncbi:MAG: PD-(D/E)XK nuclease family protein [Eubacteriales bacterium]|nr:PD-(D/E)XK nuclease family protein [Eubacteriales bacterium]